MWIVGWCCVLGYWGGGDVCSGFFVVGVVGWIYLVFVWMEVLVGFLLGVVMYCCGVYYGFYLLLDLLLDVLGVFVVVCLFFVLYVWMFGCYVYGVW